MVFSDDKFAVTLQGSITVHSTWETHKIFECLTTTANLTSFPKLDSVAEEKPDSPLASWECWPAQCCCDSKYPPKSLFSFLRPLGHSVAFGCQSHFLDNSQYPPVSQAKLRCSRTCQWGKSYPCNLSRENLGAANLSWQNSGPLSFSGLLTARAGGDVHFHTSFFLPVIKILKNSMLSTPFSIQPNLPVK